MPEQLQIALLAGLFRMLAWLPPRLTGAVGAGLGRAAFYLHGRRRAIAVRNVTRIYPERNRRWRRRVARESFAELGRVIMELPHVFMRPRAWLRARVTVEGENELHAALSAGKGAIIAAYHHGNWELCGVMYSTLVSDANCIYRAFREPMIERFVRQRRERFGATMRPRQEGLRWLPRKLKQGRSVYILLDQHLSGGMPVPFIGHLANTTTVPATFALKYGTPVVGLALHRVGRGFRFRLKLWRIDTPKTTGDRETDLYNIMRHIGKSFEPVIHQRPELWLWSHQRWKLLEEHPDIAEVVHGTP